VKGKILRPLGRFDDVVAYLKGLQKHADFQVKPITEIIAYEIRLSGQRDSAPHDMAETSLAPGVVPQ
jgi:hypothetical protein